MKVSKWIVCALAILPAAAFAQFDFGGEAPTPAWKQFKLNPKTKIKLDFRNASIDMILAFYAKSSGITIIKDPALSGNITLTSPKPVSLDEAFDILNVTLELKNYELKKQGNSIVARARRSQDRGASSSPFGGMTADQITQMMTSSRPELKVYPLQYANASQVARVVNDVFAQSQNPFEQMMQMMGGSSPVMMTQGGNTGGNQGGGGRNPFQFNRQGGGGMNFGRGGFGGFGGQRTSSVRASSDDYSNSVIVNAPGGDQKAVADLIKQIDKETEQPLRPVVYKLEYAAATDIATAVQNVLTTNAPRGRGGAGQTNVPFEQRLQQAFRFGNTQAAFGTVVADNRTNSLVVTATEENHELVKQVLKDLDAPVKLESATFVFPLENARADQVATLLNQTFGNRTGVNNAGGRNNSQVGRSPQAQNRNNNAGGNRGGGFEAVIPTEEEIAQGALNLDNIDPNTGQLYDEVYVQQGGGFQFFQQGGNAFRQGGNAQQGRANQPAFGRDAQGRLVNVRDLTNQVTVIPDQNTNSLIVVTSPDNLELLKSILGQLDRIPEQVMIETIIVEATLDASTKFGVEWKFSQTKPFGTPGTTGQSDSLFGLQNASPALQGFRYTLSGGSLTAFMNALATDKKFQVLSTPRIFTSNNSEAQINISQRIPYVLSSREDQNGNLTFTYAFEDVGIILTVTPRITSNGYVTMDINQTANDLQGFTDFNAPIINQREADTTVSVQDGETIILGGIIRNTVTSTVKKIPLLGDIPLLGNLFKSQDKQDVKTELLVFLTPRVVRDPAEAKRLREEEQKKLSKQSQDALDKVKKGGNASVKAQEPPKQDPPKTTGGGGA